MKQSRQARVGGLVVVCVVASAGCVGVTTPFHDAQFGSAVRQAKQAQTINPTAPAHGDPVAGLDGAAGRAVVERYQESFRAPPPSFEVLNIGGSTTGATSR
jgi:hypothetical protein